MERNKRRRAWSLIVLIQDISIACVLTAIIALLVGADELIEFVYIISGCYLAIKLFDNVIFSFFDGLANNSFLQKYLFGTKYQK
ncbi:MAG: hypothetical protein VX023_05440 [Candidatus Thermoplasmatota archaeon]|nr:hypothetical protein [Candidatus Thermoplasmatota archaeon]